VCVTSELPVLVAYIAAFRRGANTVTVAITRPLATTGEESEKNG